MVSLIKVTSITRDILKWGSIALLGAVVLLILVRIGVNLRNKYFPPPPPPPTVAFGKLPDLFFPKSITSQKLSYSIDTTTGALPAFPPQAKVYKAVKAQPALLSLQKTREKVAQLGFTLEERAISTRLYQWNDKEDKTIKFDIVSNDFDITSSFYNNKIVQEAKKIPNPEEAKRTVITFLDRAGLLPSDLDVEGAKINFFVTSGNQIVPTTSLSNAQIIRVDVFQKPLDKLPIVSLKNGQSQMYFLIGSDAPREGGQIVEAHFFYRAPDTANPSTYPIKTIETAFDELKNNNAYVAVILEKTIDEVAIKNVQLGYYINSKNQEFFNPIFVFEGNNGFTAYVSAVVDEFIEKPNQ